MGDHRLRKEIRKWKHLFKLDPAKELQDEQIERICASNTDAIIVGGTDHITYEGVIRLLRQLLPYDKPYILEVSTMDAIVLGFDSYFVPIVMNSQETKWMMDLQHEAIKRFRTFLDDRHLFFEGYCVLNERSKVFSHTNCWNVTMEDVCAYAYMAEHVFHLPIFYMEYSGTYGDPTFVKEVKQELQNTLLFYGGGIKTYEQAEEMSQYADIIVVGNSLYTNFEEALKTANIHKK